MPVSDNTIETEALCASFTHRHRQRAASSCQNCCAKSQAIVAKLQMVQQTVTMLRWLARSASLLHGYTQACVQQPEREAGEQAHHRVRRAEFCV